MVTQKQAKEYYKDLYDEGTMYVWGFNSGTIISRESIDKAYKEYGSDKYDRAYYEAKLVEGKGKNGSDCSGAHYPLSGYDTTAQGYYDKCKEKGKFNTLPRNEVVLLFKGVYVTKVDKKTGERKTVLEINHTGTYLGDGMCVHMKSSKANCVYEKVENHGWTHWGKPEWIDYTPTGGYTHDDFVKDVESILGVKTVQKAFDKTITISVNINHHNALVTPLERYMKELGYYDGKIEADEAKTPTYGNGMKKAIMSYQREIVKSVGNDVDGVITKKQKTWKSLLFGGDK